MLEGSRNSDDWPLEAPGSWRQHLNLGAVPDRRAGPEATELPAYLLSQEIFRLLAETARTLTKPGCLQHWLPSVGKWGPDFGPALHISPAGAPPHPRPG